MIAAYSIGINLAVTNNVSQAVGQINQSLGGLQRQMGSLNALFHGHQMRRWGEDILGGMKHLVEVGKELNTEFVRSLTLGGQIAEQAARNKSDAISGSMALPGWAPSQLNKLNTELSTQVGTDEARQMRDILAKMGTVLSFSTGGKDGGPEAILAAYKAVEAVGGAYKEDGHGGKEFSQEKFERYMNSLTASILSTGGLFSTHDAMMASRQAGPALRMMEPEVLFPYLAEAAIQMGAPKAGTATMSWARQFGGGVMTPRAATAMESIGLLHPGEWTKEQGKVVVADEARRRLAEALKDPPAWVRDVLMPKMAGKSPADLMAVMMSLASTQTVARIISDLEQNNPQFFRARANAANVPSVNDNFNLINGASVAQNMENVTSAWKGLQEVVTDAMAPQLITGMHALTEAIHWVTTEVTAHPQAAAYIGEFAIALGALTLITGRVAMLRSVIGLNAFGVVMQVLLQLTGLPVLAGSLRLVSAGLAAIAAIPGLATAAAAITGVGTALAAIIGAVQGFRMTPEEHQNAERRLNQLGHDRLPTAPSNMVPQDGFGPDGRPTAQPMGYHTQMPTARPVVAMLGGSLRLTDEGGRTLAHALGDRLAASMVVAPRGSYAPDPGISPLWGPQLA